MTADQYRDFIVEWLGPMSILIGGTFVFLKWFLERHRQRQLDKPALSVSLSAKAFDLSDDTFLGEISLRFLNHSPFYVYFSREDTSIEVLEIPEDLEAGFCSTKGGFGTEVLKKHPFEKSNVFSEPRELSMMFANLVLKKGKLYQLRWKLSEKGASRSWTRQLIIDARRNLPSELSTGSLISDSD